ncbi:TetR/AcrR family transcriptional regulator [Collinsella sp. AGMB00827]|uniref:TetR/AcrR family transcriptional regulator n=1 Tax=Collinsella ureilytica TaxID=2869515 RepID=A0ABS7MJK9_9ACTN|nr:TetR/AcrR family transcriptional regulator [Collinsella urealyticum]MBY4797539.1 TetR/AcrR family transcriptional regulator [Collinsella urealyticum]
MRVVKTKSERKEEILEAAKTVFLRKGFEAATMEDIIAETSLSKGGFYHYYANTTDIMHDLMLQGIAYRIDIISHTIPDGATWDDETLINILVDKFLDESDLMSLYVIYLQASYKNHALKDLFEQLKQENRSMFEKRFGAQSQTEMNLFYSDLFLNLLNTIMLGAEILDARESFRKNRPFFVSMMRLALTYAREDRIVT